jgi:IS66 C-terminal element
LRAPGAAHVRRDAERKIRAVARTPLNPGRRRYGLPRSGLVQKKNWLFFGDAGAGQRGAILYPIVESCRRRGVEAYAYLRDVLSRLPQLTN